VKKKQYDRKHLKEVLDNDISDNPGLDADGSSEDSSIYSNLNNDNDRISGNPDGEDDQNDTNEPPGHSPLTDK
jgi:DNA-directed RNA polymerase specialized sigma54-like protein